MKLIIVRHGETEENARHIFMGQRQGTLNAKGKEQARKLANKLKGYHIDMVFSSDLRRAADTTKAIVKYHKVPVKYTKELREQHLGSFQGRKWDAYDRARRMEGASETSFRPPGGESFTGQRNRVRAFLRRVYKGYRSKTVLISAHAGIAWCLVSIYLRIPLAKTKKMVPKNCGVIVLEIDGTEAKIVSNTLFPGKLL